MAGGAGLAYYFAADGPKKLLNVLKGNKPAQKGSNLPSTGGGGPSENELAYLFLMAMAKLGNSNSLLRASAEEITKCAFNLLRAKIDEMIDFYACGYKYGVKGEKLIVPVKGMSR